ncbi:MAG: HNH endonuclease [Rhodospirillales bacterium]
MIELRLPMPTVAELHGWFEVRPDDGVLIRRSTGRPVGTPDHAGYLVARAGASTWRVHRMIWAMVHGAWPGSELDHIDGDRTNNRIGNLRCVTRTGNNQNRRSANASSRVGILGVSFCRRTGRYVAQIGVDGTNKFLGRYPTAAEAHAAYVRAKRELHPTCTL